MMRINKDGFNSLIQLFDGKEERLKEFFITNTVFFHPDIVKEQVKEFQAALKDKQPVPVRFTMKSKEHFYFNNEKNKKGKSKRSFKNKKEAIDFARQNELFHNGTGIKVSIDNDGNYKVKETIRNYLNLTVSRGVKSDLNNYTISHIWGETANPYFFTSLWNITLIPTFLAFLLDKSDEHSALVRDIKGIMKAVCLQLYAPCELMGVELPLIKSDMGEYESLAKNYVESGKLLLAKQSSDFDDCN